jgi:hypothetical protein
LTNNGVLKRRQKFSQHIIGWRFGDAGWDFGILSV